MREEQPDFERPTSAADSPGFLLWRVTLAWQRSIAAVLKPLDLTHAQFVLLAGAGWLSAREGPPTQRRLADHSGTEPMMTSQVLRTLERKGLVGRAADGTDTRAKRVTVTEAGARLLEHALYVVERADAHFFAPVPRDAALAVLHPLSERWGRPAVPPGDQGS